MKRAYSSEYFVHLKRLVRIMSGELQKDFSGLNSASRIDKSEIDGRSTRGSTRYLRKGQTLGEYQRKWDIRRQNERLARCIANPVPVVNFKKSEEEYRKHLKDRKVRRQLSTRHHKQKEVRIIDVVWRNTRRNCRQVLTIKNPSRREYRTGTLDELRLLPMKLTAQDTPVLEIAGDDNKQGSIVVGKMNIVPIMHKKRHIGEAILDINFA